MVNSGSLARRRLLSFAARAAAPIAMVVAMACSGSEGTGPTSSGTGGSGGSAVSSASSTSVATSSAASTSGASGTGGAAPGLPCDVADALQAQCTSCHSNPTKFKAPMPLVTYADLTAKSLIDPAQTFADRCVARMQNPAKPMPPGAGVSMTPEQIASFTTWIQAGYPPGDCLP